MNKTDYKLPEFSIERIFTLAEFKQISDWGHEFMQPEKVYHKTRGENAVIFILDTAADFEFHPDLKANTLPELNKDFTGGHSSGDKNGHGTHCAGIAAASDNEIGTIGIAPDAKLVAIKVISDKGTGSYDWIVKAINYIASLDLGNKKKIVSMSISGGYPSEEIRNAIINARENDCLFIAAAGNSGFKEGKNTIGFPARYDEVICVGSINSEGISTFSSAGKEIDLAAPGSSIYSTLPPNKYGRMNGTSMACPQVAGCAALVWSMYPEMSAKDFQEFFVKHSSDWWTEGFDERSGHGIPFPANYLNKETVSIADRIRVHLKIVDELLKELE